jgi:hypothetical protein
VQVGSDDDGYAVRLKLEHYLAYVHDREHAQVLRPLPFKRTSGPLQAH